jgi:tRNA uridine 5-carboxymethylaminomethyl modification enzyme
MAGINATLKLRGESALILHRDQGYIGVMIDDLVTRGIGGEPYRMFTSRAEYRLTLREDNADRRLSPIGERLGLLDSKSGARARIKTERVTKEIEQLSKITVMPTGRVNLELSAVGSSPLTEVARAIDLLRRPEVTYTSLMRMVDRDSTLDFDQAAELEVEVKYDGYVRRQAESIERFRRLENAAIPDSFDYGRIPGLSTEVRERLAAVRPSSLGQAARMPGITPAAVSILAVYLRSGDRGRAA